MFETFAHLARTLAAPDLEVLGRLAPDDALDACRFAAACARDGRTRAAKHWIREARELADPRDIRAASHLARIQRVMFANPGEAARILAGCASRLLVYRETTAAHWLALVHAWHEHGDGDTARDYLPHAEAEARDPASLCAIAAAQRALGVDRGLVGPVVERAAAMAVEIHDRALVARTYAEVLDDRSRAVQLLASEPADLDEAIVIAHALRDLGVEPAAAWERVRRLAAGVSDGDLELAICSLDQPTFPRPFDSAGDYDARDLPRLTRCLEWPSDPLPLHGVIAAELEHRATSRGFSDDRAWRIADATISLPADLALTRASPYLELPVDIAVRALSKLVAIGDDAALYAPLAASCITLGTAVTAAAIPYFARHADTSESRDDADFALVAVAAWLDPGDPRLPRIADRIARAGTPWRPSPLQIELARTVLAPPADAIPCLARLAERLLG